jgi:hypothetical protein
MSTTDTQELARKFNEDEAVWRAFERSRLERPLFSKNCPLSEECLDALDWAAAEREARPVHAIGILVP